MCIRDRLSWKPLNFKALRPYRHRVIFIGSFSKTYAMTGWRLGWISAPRRWGEALLKTHQALVSGVAGFAVSYTHLIPATTRPAIL